MKQYPDTEWSDPVLGVLSRDEVGDMLGTRYKRFRSPSGIDGLAKRDGLRLDILAVVATKPSTGQFRKFIRQCQGRFEIVCVWHDFNPLIGDRLRAYGFQQETDVDEFGDTLTGWRWDKAKDAIPV